jgi:hypothetical protein
MWRELPKTGEIGMMDFELFDWSDAVKNFQQSKDYRETAEWQGSFKVASNRAIRLVADNTIEIDNKTNVFPSFASHNAELIPQVAEVRKLIEEKHNIDRSTHRVNCHIFMSLVSKSDGLNFHFDTENTYIWQILGDTTWKVKQGVNDDDVIEEFELNPNDMIYIPKYWKHCPVITGPRCSVSFSIEENLYNSVEERSDI